MLLAFLIRILIVWRLEQVITPDGVQYILRGKSLIAGDLSAGLSPYSQPLFSWLIGLTSLIFSNAEFAGRFVSVLAGSLLVIPSFTIIRIWYGPRAALLGAGLIALHPLLIYYSSEVLNESTYTLFFISAVLAGWSALEDGRARLYLLAGTTFGLCYLVKPEAMGFLFLLIIFTLGQKILRSITFRTSIKNALLLCGGFLLMAAPYLFYLRRVTGAWTISGKLRDHMWQGSRRGALSVTPLQPPAAPDFETMFVQLTKALRFEFEIFNLIFPLAFVLLAGLGLFRKSWNRERALRELYLFSFVLATLAGYAVTLPNIRFLVPLLPLLLCWVSQGVLELAEWTDDTFLKFKRLDKFWRPVRTIFVPVVVAALLVTLIPLFVYLIRGDKWGDYYGQKRAAIWIKEHEATPAIMSTVPIPSHYAGGRYVALVDEDYAAMIERARRERVRYIVVNERDFKYLNQSLRPLLDEQSNPLGLRRVYHSAETPGHKILVYVLDDPQQLAITSRFPEGLHQKRGVRQVGQ